MDHHLAQPTEREAWNIRNGHNHKTVLTEMHAMPVDVPRDRLRSLEPRLIETVRGNGVATRNARLAALHTFARVRERIWTRPLRR